MHNTLAPKQTTSPYSYGMESASPTARAKPQETLGVGVEIKSSAETGANTSLLSHLPTATAAYDVPLPIGKYYPSNYEQRPGSRLNNVATPSTTSGNHDTAFPAAGKERRRRRKERDEMADDALGKQ